MRTSPLVACLVALTAVCTAQRQMEHLGRGVVAVGRADGSVFVSWRLLGTDPDTLAFDVFRETEGKRVKLNDVALAGATHFVDRDVHRNESNAYSVCPVDGANVGKASAAYVLPAAAPSYISIPMRTLAGYGPNDVSVGDLDGDGEYELVVHQVGVGRDNSHSGDTTVPVLEAYELDGTRMWRIELGKNIREGAHYTQFMVYDLDGDGRAEVACKTADGTIDGRGKAIGNADAVYVDSRGFILRGPEYLTIFDGKTGAALATEDYVPQRGDVRAWGDSRGNRVDRFLACIAYLDGNRPSLIMCRGYYTRTVIAAWNWRGGRLRRVWTFDSDRAGNGSYAGQGNHSVGVADVDADGRDEIVYGSCCIDDDGEGLYSTRLGHGDAQHLSDLDPTRPGLELFSIHERPRHEHAINVRDANTGEVLWSAPSRDVGRGLALDIDPRYPGHECWASGPGLRALYSVRGKVISRCKPRSCNMGVWWDGDLLRELLDDTAISKWDFERGRTLKILDAGLEGCASNNGTKANPCLAADVLGDWREEVIWRTADKRELRIYTTTTPTKHRLYTLMHDPVYRLGIAWQNVGYNQPAHTSFFLGHGMEKPPRPRIKTVRPR